MNELEAKLENLLIGEKDFQLLESSFETFCPFESLGMVWAEIRHSNFLRTLLDPFRPHGYGSRLLRAVLLEAVSAKSDGNLRTLSKLDIHVLNLDEAEVRREWRNLDLLVVVPSAQIVFAFELKIESSQGDGQLSRYRKIVEDTWPTWRKVYVFLTKYREAPSDDAWIPMRLNHLVEALERTLDTPGAQPFARDMLAAYLSMIRKHHMDNERLAKLATSIWSRHREALEFLMERKPDPMGELFSSLREETSSICATISKLGVTVVPDKSAASYLRFAVKDWDKYPGFTSGQGWTPSGRIFLFEITWSESDVAAGFVLGPGDAKPRQSYLDALQKAGLFSFSKPPGKFKWLRSEILFSVPDEEEFDHTNAVETAKANFVNFVTHLTKACSRAFDSVRG